MTETAEDIILYEVRETRKEVTEIRERLARVEERTSKRATIFGLFGGLLAGLPPLIYWIVK